MMASFEPMLTPKDSNNAMTVVGTEKDNIGAILLFRRKNIPPAAERESRMSIVNISGKFKLLSYVIAIHQAEWSLWIT